MCAGVGYEYFGKQQCSFNLVRRNLPSSVVLGRNYTLLELRLVGKKLIKSGQNWNLKHEETGTLSGTIYLFLDILKLCSLIA